MTLPVGSYTQVAYVVNDLDATVDRWVRLLGAGPFYFLDNFTEPRVYRGEPARDKSVGAMGCLGATIVEFWQPTDDEPSMYREVLDKHGDGAIHHTLKVRPTSPEEFDAECAKYDAAGLDVVMTGGVPDAGRVAFYDTLDEIGQFIEVFEMSPAVYPLVDLMHDAHVGWDGSEPRRVLGDLFAAVLA